MAQRKPTKADATTKNWAIYAADKITDLDNFHGLQAAVGVEYMDRIIEIIEAVVVEYSGRELWLVDHDGKAGELVEHEDNAQAIAKASPFKAAVRKVIVIPLDSGQKTPAEQSSATP